MPAEFPAILILIRSLADENAPINSSQNKTVELTEMTWPPGSQHTEKSVLNRNRLRPGETLENLQLRWGKRQISGKPSLLQQANAIGQKSALNVRREAQLQLTDYCAHTFQHAVSRTPSPNMVICMPTAAFATRTAGIDPKAAAPQPRQDRVT
jgi:hypothetical protein